MVTNRLEWQQALTLTLTLTLTLALLVTLTLALPLTLGTDHSCVWTAKGRLFTFGEVELYP